MSTGDGGPGQPVTYRQGVILEWDPTTLANVVFAGRAELQNVHVLGVAEAATLKAGSTVGLLCVGSQWFIVGRLVIPDTTDAIDAISQLGQQTYVDIVTTAETTTSLTFTDLATVGPRVSSVPARVSGKALVTVSAHLAPGDLLPGVAAMDFEVASPGGTFRSPQLETALTIATTNNDGVLLGASRVSLVTGLTPGTPYTYTAKYRRATGADADFQQRQISVVNI